MFSLEHLYLKQVSQEIGLGVFTRMRLEQGDIVETSPMILIETPYNRLETSLQLRVFAWGKLTKNDDTPFALALGFGSLYNHANPANLQYCADGENNLMTFKAVRTILEGEQLTINYNGTNGAHTSVEDSWFKTANIVPQSMETY